MHVHVDKVHAHQRVRVQHCRKYLCACVHAPACGCVSAGNFTCTARGNDDIHHRALSPVDGVWQPTVDGAVIIDDDPTRTTPRRNYLIWKQACIFLLSAHLLCRLGDEMTRKGVRASRELGGAPEFGTIAVGANVDEGDEDIVEPVTGVVFGRS